MAKDDFKAHVIGFEYSNINGTGWPDSVELENGKPFMVDGDINGEYEQRTYYPVDVKALLALADEMEQEPGPVCGVCMGWSANRIRKALKGES